MPYDPPYFKDAHLKIKRTREHIDEFDAHAAKVFGSDFAPYTHWLDFDAESGECIDRFSATREVITRFAILAGDAIHNLRTALDFAWFELTAADSPVPENRIRFPVYPTRKLLEDFINSRKEQQSVVLLSGKLLDVIKPYKGGNLVGDLIYALHQLDIRDKHRLLIPQTQVSHIWAEEAAEDSTAENVVYGPDLINTHGAKDKYQGQLSASIVFGEGASPVEGKPVPQTLRAFETAVNATLLILR